MSQKEWRREWDSLRSVSQNSLPSKTCLKTQPLPLFSLYHICHTQKSSVGHRFTVYGMDGMDVGASNQANRKSGRVHDSGPTTANSDPFIRIQANQNLITQGRAALLFKLKDLSEAPQLEHSRTSQCCLQGWKPARH